MWQSGKVALWHLLLRHFLPVLRICLLYPAVTPPAGDDVSQGRLSAVAAFQRAQIFHGERGRELVKHRVIGTIPLALILSVDILRAESLAKGCYLLREAIVCHHQGKLDTSLGDARETLPLTPP